ncbi:MAG: AbrB/MazE/SpoVT family DNA-binding domain-containing protein [Pirellulales bacterium]
MRIDLVKIGNSQGIRLPKAIVEQAKLTDKLDLEVSEGSIIIRSAHRPREAWEEAAIACHTSAEDRLGDWDATMSDFEGPW